MRYSPISKMARAIFPSTPLVGAKLEELKNYPRTLQNLRKLLI